MIEGIEASHWLRRFCEDHAIILGSSSKWRRKVLSSASLRIVDSVDPAIDEKAIRFEKAEKLVLAISHAKADSCMQKIPLNNVSPEKYLVCTDQVALCDDEIREKPESEEQARAFIHSYSEEGKPAETVSGVVVVHVASGRRVEGVYHNKIFFDRIPAEVVEEIVKGEVVYTTCGAFSADWPVMAKFVKKLEGGMDGIMGMPLSLLESLFKQILVAK